MNNDSPDGKEIYDLYRQLKDIVKENRKKEIKKKCDEFLKPLKEELLLYIKKGDLKGSQLRKSYSFYFDVGDNHKCYENDITTYLDNKGYRSISIQSFETQLKVTINFP
jgi:hypothetical protein